jgi:lactoylglutathione lyase
MFEKVDYIMITVSDMAKSVEFYRDKIGLQLKFETRDWTEFITGSTTLALHGGGVPSKPQEKGAAGFCTIGFNVKDIDAAYVDLKNKGVQFVMEPMVREGEGIKLAVALDPDGLQISFAESTR